MFFIIPGKTDILLLKGSFGRFCWTEGLCFWQEAIVFCQKELYFGRKDFAA